MSLSKSSAQPLPVIRTLADDLSDAERGLLDADAARPETPRVAATPSSPLRIKRDARPEQVLKIPKAPLITARPAKRWRVLIGVAVFVLLAGTVAVVWRWRAPLSGTVADAVPNEALAFVAVRGTDPTALAIRARLMAAVGSIGAERLAGATDVAYVLLPGAAPTQPVAGLLVRGLSTIDLGGAPDLGVKQLGPTTLFITRSPELGRLNGLSGSTWGKEREYQKRVRALPSNATVFGALRAQTFSAFLQPFFLHSLAVNGDAAFAVTPRAIGQPADIVVSFNPVSQWAASDAKDLSPATTSSVSQLPATVLFAFQRPKAYLTALTARGDELPPELRTVLQALRNQAPNFESLLNAVSGPVTVGVLPTGVSGVRDAVALLPLTPDAQVEPHLRALENSVGTFGTYLGATAPSASAFAERTYGGITIRYLNFGSPARSIDYAVVDKVLILATSRESMFAVIDVLQKRATPLAQAAHFTPIAAAGETAEWVFLRSDPAVRAEVASAFIPLLESVESLRVQVTGSGVLTGQVSLQEQTNQSASPSPSSSVSPPLPVIRR